MSDDGWKPHPDWDYWNWPLRVFFVVGVIAIVGLGRWGMIALLQPYFPGAHVG